MKLPNSESSQKVIIDHRGVIIHIAEGGLLKSETWVNLESDINSNRLHGRDKCEDNVDYN